MAWFESCTSSAGETLNPHDSIIEDSKNQLEWLRDELIMNDETFRLLREWFDSTFKDTTFNSYTESLEALYTVIVNALINSGFNLIDADNSGKIDDIFILNRLAPIKTSTAIIKGKEWKYHVLGSLSRLTCSPVVNTWDYTPQSSFRFEVDKEVPMYWELLYDFPWGYFGRFLWTSSEVIVFSGEIRNANPNFTDKEIEAYIDVVTANELWHFQFQQSIVPFYWLEYEDIFLYNWNQYSFRQVNELWSDYSSLLYAYKNFLNNESMNQPFNFELNRIQYSEWNEVYDLSRLFLNDRFEELFSWGWTLESFYQDMEDEIIEILESAKN